MKKHLVLLSLSIVHCQLSIAQNVGIGTTVPTNKLQVEGNFLVNEPLTGTATPPTAGQTKTLVNATTLNYSSSDSTGRIYDPGGPAGDYDNNLTAISTLPANGSSRSFLIITIEEIGLGTGDSLLVRDDAVNPTVTFLALGFNHQPTGTFVINSPSAAIIFKSDADGFVGSGFSLLFKRLFAQPGQTAINGYAGNVLYYDARRDAFRAGEAPADDNPGSHSAAFGLQSTASGYSSLAAGYGSTASGYSSLATGLASIAGGFTSFATGNQTHADGTSSTAMGYQTHASGTTSTAMGDQTHADGTSSTAMGSHTTAGAYCTAMGYETFANANYATTMGSYTTALGENALSTGNNTTASGVNSTAMGSYVSTLFHNGSFVIGDNATTTVMNGSADNQMSMRFAGGYRLFSNVSKSTGVTLSAGGGSWSSVSDRRKKENFRTINSEDLLQKVAALPITNWNYKSQPASQRHIGPMAQDFYAAFHLDGEGADTTINTMDISGVNMAAIQALAMENGKLKKENARLADGQAKLEAALAELQAQVKELQRSLPPSTTQK